ncbi:MAG: hypothetical protein PHE55_21295 [Methylococcaceae bacterium]|nr:hypothetical protein [Methylococcaceae bacterium]
MKLNLLLAKTFQFVVALIFITMVLFYFGATLMMALAVLWYSIKIVTFIGLPTVVSVVAGIAVLVFLGLKLSKTPVLVQTLVDIGMELGAFGYKQIQRFEPIIEAAGGAAGKSA